MGYLSGVPTRTYRGGLPFDSASIGREVERARVDLDISVIAITDRLGMPRTLWYKKIAGRPAFRLEEIAKLVREFDAPHGWPILSWNEGRAWEKHLGNHTE